MRREYSYFLRCVALLGERNCELAEKRKSLEAKYSEALMVIPEGFEPPIFWAVTRGIIQLCYGTEPICRSRLRRCSLPDCDAKVGLFLRMAMERDDFCEIFF